MMMARTKGSTADQTRARIIEVAEELFTDRGFAGTSLRDIGERLSMTTSAVYYHFTSKDALLEAVFAPIVAMLRQLVEVTTARRAALDDDDAIGIAALKATVIRQYVNIQLANPPLMRSLIFDPSAMRVMHKQHATNNFNDRLVQLLSNDEDFPARVRARCAMGSINGGLLLTATAELHADSELAPADLTALMRAHADVFVAAALAVLGVNE